MTDEENNQGATGGEPSGSRAHPASEKDRAIEERKRELQEELENYAQAGAYSPGLVKASRWVSRALYLLMAGALAFLIISGWGKYSEDEFGRQVEARKKWQEEAGKWKERAAEEKERREELESGGVMAEMLRQELESLATGAPAAERVRKEARDLVARYWGESQYGAAWRERLEHAEPGAHGDNPVGSVKSLIEQAANAPAAVEVELLREAVDFGREAATRAVLDQLDAADPAIVRTAARLGGWLGGEEIRDRAVAGVTESDEPAFAFLYAMLTGEAPPEGGQRYTPMAWVGYAMGYDAPLDELVEAYKTAPDEDRLVLLALLAETAPATEDAIFRSVATSDRPPGERIIAVQWLRERKPPGGEELLKKLSGGSGIVAEEAKRALK